ncbi:hypothetical protein, partial [Devosia psychrophila]|uniref:hypothetical protein n=1 Tax=Devosia psychrophila TaxID=728005 RepID=UPI001AEC46A4
FVLLFFFFFIRRLPVSPLVRSSAASDVYKRPAIGLMAFSLQIAPPERFALRDSSKLQTFHQNDRIHLNCFTAW